MRCGLAHEDRLHARDDHGSVDRTAGQRDTQASGLQSRDADVMPRRARSSARSGSTWPDPARCDEQAKKLAKMFIDNFVTFEKDVATSVKSAGPTL